jgi:hypothetical protein
MIYKQVPMLTHQQDGKGVRGYPIGREQHSHQAGSYPHLIYVMANETLKEVEPEIENIKATATYYD